METVLLFIFVTSLSTFAPVIINIRTSHSTINRFPSRHNYQRFDFSADDVDYHLYLLAQHTIKVMFLYV